MNTAHLTGASMPGVRFLREIKASTNKRSLDSTYTVNAKKAMRVTNNRKPLEFDKAMSIISRGNMNAIQVRMTEQTRHKTASSWEGNVKNHPAQCIPPNAAPVTNITKKKIGNSASSISEA